MRGPAFGDRGLADAPNDRKRSAELVRRVGGESPQLVERRFEPGERLVDDRRQPADFVRLIWNARGARAAARP